MKLSQITESFVISNDEFEDYLNRTTEQLAQELQSGKNARDAIHDLALQFSAQHNKAYEAYVRMSDALTARMHTLELDAPSASPEMGMEPEMGAPEMGDDMGGEPEMMTDPMGDMEMDTPADDEMPSDSDMDDYNAVMDNEPEAEEMGESAVNEASCGCCGNDPCDCDDDCDCKKVDESGILYKAGVKKYGKEGMKKIQSASGKGASAEEIGKIKDQHRKKKTKTNEGSMKDEMIRDAESMDFEEFMNKYSDMGKEEAENMWKYLNEGRMKDSVIHDSETMSKEEFAKKHGKELADEMYENYQDRYNRAAATQNGIKIGRELATMPQSAARNVSGNSNYSHAKNPAYRAKAAARKSGIPHKDIVTRMKPNPTDGKFKWGRDQLSDGVNESMEVINQIVADKQAGKLHGMTVDMFTASAIKQIYDNVSDDNKAKLDDLMSSKEGVLKAANIAMKMMKEGKMNELAPLAPLGMAMKAVGGIGRAAGAAAGIADKIGKVSKFAKGVGKAYKLGKSGVNALGKGIDTTLGKTVEDTADSIMRSSTRKSFSEYNEFYKELDKAAKAGKKAGDTITVGGKNIKLKSNPKQMHQLSDSDMDAIDALAQRLNEKGCSSKMRK